MMKNKHEAIQSFLETGVAGICEFAEASVTKTQIGKMFPHFDDTVDSPEEDDLVELIVKDNPAA